MISTAATLTIQQGVNGYSGCTDSYIESKNDGGYNGATTNHGNKSYVSVGSTLYTSY